MLYSAWNWNSQEYDLFESPKGEKPGQRPEPRRRLNGPGGRGVQLETLLPTIPRDAKQVGTSPFPRGRIALHWSSPVAGFGEDDSPFVTHPWVTLGIIIGGVWLGHRVLLAIGRKIQ